MIHIIWSRRTQLIDPYNFYVLLYYSHNHTTSLENRVNVTLVVKALAGI